MPLLLGTGAVFYFLAPVEPSFSLLMALVAAASAGTWLSRRHPLLQTLGWLLLVVALGGSAAKLETWRRSTPILGSQISTELTGRVVLVEEQANGRTRLTLDVLGTARPSLRYAPERVRVTARSVPGDVRPGEVLRGIVRLIPPAGPVRPGSYDFAFQSYFNGLGAVGFFLRDPQRVENGEPLSLGVKISAGIEALRQTIADRIRAVLPAPEGEIAAALIAGVRAGIPEAVNEDLRVTGLAHVLSISGLHMALAATTLMGSIRLLLACFPNFAARHSVKKYAAGFALAGTAFYLLLAGDQVAANRSFLMIAVMLTAILFDRAALSMRNLAIAAVCIILTAPHEVMGPSFQMSFAATAALVAGYAGWSQLRRDRPPPPLPRSLIARIRRWLLLLILGSVATSILAGGATAIYSAYHFQRVSPLSFVANLLAMPIIGIAVMPSAVAALITMPIGLDFVPLTVMGWGLTLMLLVAQWSASISPPDAVGIVPAPTVALATLALAIACFTTTRWRLLAMPLVLAASVAFAARTAPDVFVSEDAKLIGLMTENGELAVNRKRPNAFAVEDWQRSASAAALVTPKDDSAEGFHCTETGCTFAGSRQPRVTWLAEGSVVEPHCATADLIVVDDATVESRCPEPTQIVTKRDLALMGSATAQFDPATGRLSALDHAISRPYRPWHTHRRFSREARGIAPYKRPNKAEPQKTRSTADPGVSTSGSGRQGDPEP